MESENTGTPTALTFGERAVGLTFNPSGDENVLLCKKSFAKIIDNMDSLRSHPHTSEDAKRMCSIAITESQTAQMWAVKAITAR